MEELIQAYTDACIAYGHAITRNGPLDQEVAARKAATAATAIADYLHDYHQGHAIAWHQRAECWAASEEEEEEE